MKAYFAVNGLGLGHIKRCELIAENLKKNGWEIIFSTYLDGFNYAKHKGYKTVSNKPISYSVDQEGKVDYRTSFISNGISMGFKTILLQITREIQYIKSLQPDIIVSDSRASTIVAAKLLRFPIVLLTNQTRIEIARDMGKPHSVAETAFQFIIKITWFFLKHIIEYIWNISDIILIPDFQPPYTISIYNLGRTISLRKKVHFIGPIFKIQQKQTIEPVEDLYLGTEKPLIYVPISGPVYERKLLVTKLKRIMHNLKDYQFIITEGEPKKQSKLDRDKNVQLLPWVDDALQDYLMNISNVIICRAGHGLISKALFHGKPVITIPIPRHTEQMNNARRLKELEFGEILEQENLNFINLKNKLDKILSKKITFNALKNTIANTHSTDEAVKFIQYIASEKKRI